MLIPELSARRGAAVATGAVRSEDSRQRLLVGLGVGAALGFVVAPCAGPILAAVTSVSASSGASPKIVLVALSYASDSLAVMLVDASAAGQCWIGSPRDARADRRAASTVLMVTSVAIVFDVDVRFEEALAKATSSRRSSPRRSRSSLQRVQRRPASCARPRVRQAPGQAATPKRHRTHVDVSIRRQDPAFGARHATAFTGTRTGSTPRATRRSRRRGCAATSCSSTLDLHLHRLIRTLPYLKRMHRPTPLRAGHRRDKTPEFTFEQEASNVRQAISADRDQVPSSRTTTTEPGHLPQPVFGPPITS